MGGEVEKMMIIGLIWGTTNALMKRGTIIHDSKTKTKTKNKTRLGLLMTWQYTLPFLANLSASAAFFSLLSDSPISVAVPVTNATTFAATAVAGWVFGEEVRVGKAVVGTVLILIGVSICIM